MPPPATRNVVRALGTCAALIPAPALAQPAEPPPDYGFNFKTIGNPGNAPYPGNGEFGPDGPFLQRVGVGSVPYTYRMAETEVRTEQYIEFMNIVGRQDPDLALLELEPLSWGGGLDLSYAGPGFQWKILPRPEAPTEQFAKAVVADISWRGAAMYVNWLHNGKGEDPASWRAGVYDTSTFGQNPDGTFTDQLTRSPGARYWIPSEDEWLKAAHYDPNKHGPGDGGWWEYAHMSDDTAPTPGLPGEPGAQTSAGIGRTLPGGGDPWIRIDAGSYPHVRSAFGLLDVSGGAREFTENGGSRLIDRIAEGSYLGQSFDVVHLVDRAWASNGSFSPGFRTAFTGLRVASTVPATQTVTVLIVASFLRCTRRRECSGAI